MDSYVYLLLGLSLLTPSLIVFALRPDLRRMLLRVGIVGGIAGVVAEFYYFTDYWRPVGILGDNVIIEDVIAGAGIVSLIAVIYAGITKQRFTQKVLPTERRAFAGLFVIGVLAMLIFDILLGGNSVIVSNTAFIVIAAYIVYQRRDLIRPAIVTAVIMTAYIFAIYTVLFIALTSGWWSAHWLLDGTALDIKLFGQIPLTELFWYFSWSLLGSIAYPFISGKKFEKITTT